MAGAVKGIAPIVERFFLRCYPTDFEQVRGFSRLYSPGSHTIIHHRYNIVWVPKYRFKALHCAVRMRGRDILRQVCDEMAKRIIKGLLSRDHIHMLVEIPRKVAVSAFVQKTKRRSSRRI